MTNHVIGFWQCEAPLTKEQYDEDRPQLEALLTAIPAGATIKELVVWVNGREYDWQRIEVYGDRGVSSNA